MEMSKPQTMTTETRPTRKQMGEKLRTLRNERNLSQKTVAIALGIPRSGVSDLENGKRDLDFLTEAIALSRLFNVQIEDLAP